MSSVNDSIVLKITPKGIRSRQKIIDAAITSFKVKGYQETAIQDICFIADIAVGTYYHYFSSKHDLLFVMIAEMNTTLTDAYQQMDINSYPKAILQLTDLFIDIYESYGPELITNMYKGYVLSGNNLFDINQFAYVIIIRDIFARGIKEKQFSIDFAVDDVAEMVKSIFFLSSVLWCNHHDNNVFRDNAHRKIEAFLRLVSSG